MLTRLLLASCLAVSALAQNVADDKKPATPAAPAADTTAADPLASAQALLRKNKFTEAAAAFKAIVEKNPSLAEAQVGLLRSLLRNHQVDDAEEAGKKALAAAPSSAAVHAAVGDVAFRAGRFGDAEAEYRAALKLDSNSARGTFGMARMMEMVSMRKSARAAIAKAHDFDPSDGQIYDAWVRTLPRAQRLEILTKRAGDHPSEQEAAEIKLLAAETAKKPWVLVNGARPAEISLIMIGNKEVAVADINRDGPMHIGKGFGLPVKLNDRASANLLLDTGADGLVIGNKLAERAGVVKIADSAYGGVGDQGPVKSYVGWVDKIRIGDVEFRDCIVEVSSRNDVTPDAGLIGADVFSRFLITLDFREKKMLLAPLPKNPAAASEDDDEPQDRYIAPAMQSYTKAFVLDDHLFLPVVVNDKAIGNFMVDTGADMNTLSPKMAAQVTKASDSHEYVMKGVSGKVDQVLTGQKAILTIAKMRIESHDLPVFSLEGQSNYFGMEVSGFIGIRTLSQMKMTIDYRDGLMNLEVYEFKKARE